MYQSCVGTCAYLSAGIMVQKESHVIYENYAYIIIMRILPIPADDSVGLDKPQNIHVSEASSTEVKC